MSGEPWKQLMITLKETIEKTKNFAYSEGKIFISIIIFARDCRYPLKRVDVRKVNVDGLERSGGPTEFEPVFEQAYKIASRNIRNEIILFNFMTDG